MEAGRITGILTVVCLVGAIPVDCHAQGNQGLTTPAARYFMNHQSSAAAVERPASRVTESHRVARQPLQVAGGKPFDQIQRQSTLSPYLALDAVPESSTSLPNWHLFVQPELQQRSAAEARARELMQARQQMRVASARHIMPESPPAGAPITGSSTQFMNVGGYFPGLR